MARARKVDVMYIGIGSHVVAINSATGDIVWKTKLQAAMYLTVHLDGTRLYAGANGELYCLDPRTGAIVWHNKLKGLGTGLIVFTATDSSTAATAAATAATVANQAALTTVMAATV